MVAWIRAGRFPCLSRVGALLVLTLVGFALAASGAAAAPPPVLVVADDPGGSVPDRLTQIERLRREGTRVEITGKFCLSACTLYLGLPGVCVDPGTVFGFHGPSSARYGIGLTPASFDRWSRIMARQYPAVLRGWYLDVARKRTMGFHSLRGRDLVALGVAACSRG